MKPREGKIRSDGREKFVRIINQIIKGGFGKVFFFASLDGKFGETGKKNFKKEENFSHQTWAHIRIENESWSFFVEEAKEA